MSVRSITCGCEVAISLARHGEGLEQDAVAVLRIWAVWLRHIGSRIYATM